MCHWCHQHGSRDEKWYERFENYLFNRVFPEQADKERVKAAMAATFAATEWRYSDPEFIRNVEFLRERASQGFASQFVTRQEVMRILELADEAVKREDSIMVVGHCPCRLVYEGKRDYVCIGFGMPVTMSMEVGYGRLPKEGLTEFGGAEWRELRRELRKGVKVPLKLEEAKELIIEWEKRGLWHLVVSRGRLPLIEAICNCDRRYCTYFMNRERMGVKEYAYKGHFVAVHRLERCTACGTCLEYCQFGALYYSKNLGQVSIDPSRCMGCGLCANNCPNDAIAMVPREEIPVARDLW
jgi:ferredoxin